MSAFSETLHPRGQAANSGQFREKTNSAPSGTLTVIDGAGFDPDGAGCDACGVADRVPGELYCSSCLDGEGACARCEAPATGDDGLCDRHTTRWGELSLREGSRTPWGTADNVEHIAPGIAFAGTPGHGGVKLSPERNRLVPTAFRTGSGWYEEDCESYVVLRYFPEEWASQPHVKNMTVDEVRQQGEDGLKRWFPDQWEKANGRVLAPGESRAKDEREWARAHANVPIVTSAGYAESDPSMVVVWAQNGGHDGDRSTEAEYLVPKAEYNTRMENGQPGQNHRFIVDPSRHPKLPPRPKQPTERSERVWVDAEKLSHSGLSQAYADGVITATARDRIAKDLGQRWRRSDGRVETMHEILAEGGVTGKTAYQDGATMSYAILQRDEEHGGSFSLKVSKATWDYLDEVDDERSPATVAYQAAAAAQERLDREYLPSQKQKDRVAALYETYRQLREQEEAEKAAREGTPAEREAARKAAQADRERAARTEGAAA